MPAAAAMRVDLQFARDRIDGRRGAPDIQMHLAAHQLVRRDPAQHHVRIRDRRPVADSVASRTRIRARALRPYAQQSAFIHARDRSAARAHGMNIQHRHAHRKAVDGRLHGFARDAVAQAHIRRRATHVESENVRESGQARRLPMRR